MPQSEASAVPHKLLEYALTRVAITGKEKKVQTILPYEALMSSIGNETATSDYDLQITIELRWTPKHHLLADEDETEFEIDGDEDHE